MLYAQNVYDLYKYTPDDWLNLSTDERLRALNTSNNLARNQTFLGKFNRYGDLYKKWGYDYYEMNDSYENYAFRNFTNYSILESRRRKWVYNDFGDRLMKMSQLGGIWNDRINDDGTTEVMGPFGYINYLSGEVYKEIQDGVWVVKESTDDWAVALIGAERIRTKFTPLTLSIPDLNGMRIDFQSANWQASLVNSDLFKTPVINDMADHLMLRGGQLRRKFGVLNLGATFVSNYTQQMNREKGNNIKGSLTDFAPTPLYYLVRVMDDSPWDGDGPMVYNAFLKIDGITRTDIKPVAVLDDITRERNSALIEQKYEVNYLSENQPYLKFNNYYFDNNNTNIRSSENIPKYIDYLFFNDWIRGWNTSNLSHYFDVEKAKQYYKIPDSSNKPIKINGTQYLIYIFDLSFIKEKINRVEIELTLSNDYKVQVSEVFTRFGGVETKGENKTYYDATFWQTRAQADGNIKDESNLRTIKIDFGYEVANIIYGLDADFDYYGYKVKAEIVKNTHFYMFSDGVPGKGFPPHKPTDIDPRTGYRSSLSDKSYYITAQKDWEKIGFGGEYFKMGKFYRPYMDFFVPEETWNYYDRFSVIADNDDNDQFVDSGSGSIDIDGVYPGQDIDNDGIPDTDKNRNGVADSFEPFMMFDSDPENFAFGDDFNNNSIPDFREDDSKADTPYDLDRKGYHTFLRFTPQKSINFITGRMRTGGVGVGNRTNNDYFKFRVDYNVFYVGNIFAEYRYERIQDDIFDSYYDWQRQHKADTNLNNWNYEKIGRYYLDYQDSKVNKFYVQSKIKPIPEVTIENFVKFENNNQQNGWLYNNIYQLGGNLQTIALSNKIVYTKQWGNLIFSPGIKYLFYKKNRPGYILPDDHYFVSIPVIYFKYIISPKSNIILGFQGLPGMEYRYMDYINNRESFKQKDYVIQIENQSVYFGFNVIGMWGFKLEDFKYDYSGRIPENYKTSSFFVKIYVGNR